MKTLLCVLSLSTLLFPACEITKHYNARNAARDELVASQAAYQTCLKQNSEHPEKCEGLRRAFEADLKTFEALDATLKNPNVHTIFINK
jgi:hypothetical protein